MIRIITLFFLLWSADLIAKEIRTEIFEFSFEGVIINGVLNIPAADKAKGLVLIVHGSGRTNAVEDEWYLDVRRSFLDAGYATYMWDKMGCGKSEGEFDINQPVENSALEVIAAIETLREKKVPGSEAIGLWGISRAGWINPIVINKFEGIKFWISVSGVDDKENFNYLFVENLRIEGLLEDSIKILSKELLRANQIAHSGGTYEECLKAAPNLSKNKFWLRFNNGGINKEDYYNNQAKFMKEELDSITGLQVYIKDFDKLLSNIKCPVLALFGETDKNVDWKKTKALYERTLALNTNLSIQSFPNCNHNLFQCKTGGFYEFQDDKLPWIRCEGFLETMSNWLQKIE